LQFEPRFFGTVVTNLFDDILTNNKSLKLINQCHCFKQRVRGGEWKGKPSSENIWPAFYNLQYNQLTRIIFFKSSDKMLPKRLNRILFHRINWIFFPILIGESIGSFITHISHRLLSCFRLEGRFSWNNFVLSYLSLIQGFKWNWF